MSKMKYYEYSELDSTVLSYQIDSSSNSERLIEMMHAFIMKYIRLLKCNTIYFQDKRMLKFLSLFISSRENLNKWWVSPSIKKIILDKVAELNELLEPYTEEEIYNEAVITILKMASRYTSHGGPRFHLYIDRCFSLYFKRQIENLIKDPLLHECCHYNDSLLLKDTIDEETIIDDVDYGACLQTDSLTFGDTDRFGANWVSGLTTDRAFKSLTPLDRKILIHHYIDGHTDKETAESIGYGARETVTRRRNQAKRRVEEYGQVYKLLNV